MMKPTLVSGVLLAVIVSFVAAQNTELSVEVAMNAVFLSACGCFAGLPANATLDSVLRASPTTTAGSGFCQGFSVPPLANPPAGIPDVLVSALSKPTVHEIVAASTAAVNSPILFGTALSTPGVTEYMRSIAPEEWGSTAVAARVFNLLKTANVWQPVEGYLMPGDEFYLFHKAWTLPFGGTIIEIGAYQGRSTVIMSSALACRGNWAARLVSVSLFPFENWKRYSNTLTSRNLGHVVYPINSRSFDASFQIPERVADFVFVDGDHSSMGAMLDIEAYWRKLHDRASSIPVLAGHDALPLSREVANASVRTAVETFCVDHNLFYSIIELTHFTFELVDPSRYPGRPMIPRHPAVRELAEVGSLAACECRLVSPHTSSLPPETVPPDTFNGDPRALYAKAGDRGPAECACQGI